MTFIPNSTLISYFSTCTSLLLNKKRKNAFRLFSVFEIQFIILQSVLSCCWCGCYLKCCARLEKFDSLFLIA